MSSYKWEVVDDYDGTVTGMISEIGHCVICEAGEYSMGDISAPECTFVKLGCMHPNRGVSLVRGVGARSARILVISLKYHECHRITHSYHYTLKNYDSYYSLMPSNVTSTQTPTLEHRYALSTWYYAPDTGATTCSLSCRMVSLLNDHIHVYLVNRERFRLRPLAIDVSIVKMEIHFNEHVDKL